MKIAKDILLKNKDAYIKNNQKLIIQILEEYQFYLSKKKKKKNARLTREYPTVWILAF